MVLFRSSFSVHLERFGSMATYKGNEDSLYEARRWNLVRGIDENCWQKFSSFWRM